VIAEPFAPRLVLWLKLVLTERSLRNMEAVSSKLLFGPQASGSNRRPPSSRTSAIVLLEKEMVIRHEAIVTHLFLPEVLRSIRRSDSSNLTPALR
jgi:hypothetical protein